MSEQAIDRETGQAWLRLEGAYPEWIIARADQFMLHDGQLRFTFEATLSANRLQQGIVQCD